MENLDDLVRQLRDPGTPEEQLRAADALFNAVPKGQVSPDIEELAARAIAANPGMTVPPIAVRAGRVLINHQDPNAQLQGARLLLQHLNVLDDDETLGQLFMVAGTPGVEELAVQAIAETIDPAMGERVGRILLNHPVGPMLHLQGARLLLPRINELAADPTQVGTLAQLLRIVTHENNPGTPEEQLRAADALFNAVPRGDQMPPGAEERAARVIAANPGMTVPPIAVRAGRILLNLPDMQLQGVHLLLQHLNVLDDDETLGQLFMAAGTPGVEEAAVQAIAETLDPTMGKRVGHILLNHPVGPMLQLQGARLLLPHLDALDDETRQRVQTLLDQQ
ncbi:MAG: hypothetical protein LBJ70_01275 [Holosporales bacterium]|jgi:hypothetical protein|nr:hypothetical protein [Holosporales bacterium]